MVTKANRHRPLPRRFGKFFWDVAPHRVDVNQHSEYIIARLLEYGDLTAIHWLIKTYRTEEIVEVVKSSRQLSRKTANFWRLRLNIPTSKVHALKRSYFIAPEPFY